MAATVVNSSSPSAAENSSKWQQFLSSQTASDTGGTLGRDHATVLIVGVPGCGKRTLLKSIAFDIERQLARNRNPGFYHGNSSRGPSRPPISSMSRISTGCQGNEDVKNRAASTNVVSESDESLLAASMAAQAAIAGVVPRMAPIDYGYLPAVMIAQKDKDNNMTVELGTLSLVYCEHSEHANLISEGLLRSSIAHARFAAVICLDMMHLESVIGNFESHIGTISQIHGPIFDSIDMGTQELLYSKVTQTILKAKHGASGITEASEDLEWLSNRGFPLIIVLMRCDAFGKTDPMKWRPVLVHLRHRASQYGATIVATDASEFSSLRECDAITAGITARNGRIFYEHLVAQIYGRTLPDKRGDDGGKALLCLSPGQDGGPDAFRHSLNVEDAEFLSRPIETFFDSDSDEERVREEEAQPVTTVDSMKVFLSRMAERMPAPMNAPSSPQTATTPVTNRSFFQNLLVKEPGSSARKGAPEVR